MTTTKTPTQADENRICLLNDVPAARVKTALTNTKARLELIERETAAAHRAAMDPTASDEAIASSRAAVTDLAFERERLTNAVERLTERHASLVAAELKAARQEEHSTVKAERDALITEVRERYPQLTGELVELFQRIKDNNARVDDVNRNSGGLDRLEYAEGIARGSEGLVSWPNGGGPVGQLVNMQILNFDRAGVAWPVRGPGMMY